MAVRITQAQTDVANRPGTERIRVTQVSLDVAVKPSTGFPVMAPGVWPGVFLTAAGRFKTTRPAGNAEQPRK